MGRTRVYINPFDITGAYTTYQDVTRYVSASIPKIKRKMDNNNYNIGVFTYSNVSLKFDNSTGLFSDVDSLKSMFAFKRAGSKVKITWEYNIEDCICGIAVCGECIASAEETIFEGLLNDDGSKTGIRDQDINFTVLGFESIFSQVEVPFASLSNGDDISDIIYDCLNQTAITDLLTVSAGNITLSIDPSVDDVSDLENKTVKEALDDLLELSNSILYIEDNTVYVTARTPSASVQHTFYGQAAPGGIEDIQQISQIRAGLNKTFNFWTWEDTTLAVQDNTSVDTYGIRKKEIGYSGVTNNTTRTNILTDLKDEFKNPKQEMILATPLTYETLELSILDRVDIDYPTVFFPADDNPLPLFGVAIFGTARFPFGEWSLTIDTTKNYKILGKDIQLEKELIAFSLREI